MRISFTEIFVSIVCAGFDLISVKDILNQVKTSTFVLSCEMPLGYVTGMPILQIKNEQLCLLIPFMRYRVTGQVDKTLVFPIRYTVTMVLPEQKMVNFADLSFQSQYQNVDFNAPVGYFRHEAIQHLNKQEYMALRDELMTQYDKVIGTLLYNEAYSEEDEQRMRELLTMLTEPSLLPIYKALDESFYNKYLA